MEPEIKNLGKVSATVEGEHRLNRDYKRLSIVNITQDNGTASYISKRYVPKNISILDTYYWMPLVTPASGGGSSTIEGLTDVYIDNLINGQILVYNSLLNKWVNGSNAANSYICTFTLTTDPQTEESVISCDKTVAEIIAAANAGKIVLGKTSGGTETGFIPLNLIYYDIVVFGGLIANPFGNNLIIIYGVHNSSTDSDEWNNQSLLLGTASQLDVPSSGNATSSQVVKGDDTRLTDPRPASDVYQWAKAVAKPSYTASEVGAIPTTEKGANGGVAELDSTGKVPSSQLPSYVDETVEGYLNNNDGKFYEDSSYTTEITGQASVIYVTLDTNKTYRWSGSAFVEISKSLALGETSSTAYPGNKGKAVADLLTGILDSNVLTTFRAVEIALANKLNKSSTAGLVKNDGTIDTNTYLTQQVNADWNATSGAAKILNKPTIPASVSGTNDGTNWTSLTIGDVTKNIPSAGLTTYDFTHHQSQSVDRTVTVTYNANTRGSRMVFTANTLSVAFAVNNYSDNYLWIKNTGSADIEICIASVTHNDLPIDNVYVPEDGITVPAGKVCEIGIIVNPDGAFISSRSDFSIVE